MAKSAKKADLEMEQKGQRGTAPKADGKEAQPKELVSIRPMSIKHLNVTIEGLAPMIQHQWSEKARTQMREKTMGKKTKNREARNPEQEYMDAMYKTPKGGYAVPVCAIKNAVISAAHKDIGIEKTLVRKAFFILSPNVERMLPIKCTEPFMREDNVRIGMGSADLRYRPQFDEWETTFTVEYDADLLRPDDIVNLIDRAGFGIGICEWRPEKNGDYGRFRVKRGD